MRVPTISLISLIAVAGCSSGPATPDASTDARADTASTPDIVVPTDAPEDRAPIPYDAGPPPSCTVMSSSRRIVDRPGLDHVADPVQLIDTGDGFLVALRAIQMGTSTADAGTDASADARADGSVGDSVLSDRSVILPLSQDGTPSAAVTLFDGAPTRSSAYAPQLHRTPTGIIALHEEVRGNASSPEFLLRVHTSIASTRGVVSETRVARNNVSLPDSARIETGVLALGARIESIGDGGLVSAAPISVHLDFSGMNVRAVDTLLTAIYPTEVFDPHTRTTPEGGAIYAYRRLGRLGFIPFTPNGLLEPTGTFDVPGTNVPLLDDVRAVGDGVIAAWSRNNPGGIAEIHVVIASRSHVLRRETELERFTGEGTTAVSVVPVYGGAALLWRRGVDAQARVRIAVVAPDGTIRVPPQDLIAIPNLEGRVAASAQGRELTIVARDGRTATQWGYSFARVCVPTM
ncbi:MAG: hypothetical protein Q8Q09_09530 [Deltaproteobacteria bacterium]|nr:hypothetical protein [Deltaproteobacteria bacterium]